MNTYKKISSHLSKPVRYITLSLCFFVSSITAPANPAAVKLYKSAKEQLKNSESICRSYFDQRDPDADSLYEVTECLKVTEEGTHVTRVDIVNVASDQDETVTYLQNSKGTFLLIKEKAYFFDDPNLDLATIAVPIIFIELFDTAAYSSIDFIHPKKSQSGRSLTIRAEVDDVRIARMELPEAFLQSLSKFIELDVDSSDGTITGARFIAVSGNLISEYKFNNIIYEDPNSGHGNDRDGYDKDNKGKSKRVSDEFPSDSHFEVPDNFTIIEVDSPYDLRPHRIPFIQ